MLRNFTVTCFLGSAAAISSQYNVFNMAEQLLGQGASDPTTELAGVAANNWEELEISVDGKPKTVYIASPDWFEGGSSAGADALDIPWGGRVYLAEAPNVDPEAIFKPKLLGGYLEYTVDLSATTCGCVAALYTSLMPGRTPSGDYEPSGDGLYYCDASAVDGNYCPEFDVMEANQWSWRSTAHACTNPTNGHYESCDRSGQCHVSHTQLEDNDWGPGSTYKIDTRQPVEVRVDFSKKDGNWASYTVTLSQGSEQLELVANCPTQLHALTDSLEEGMAILISNWSTSASLDWLQEGSCSGSCGKNGLAISNIRVSTSDAVAAGPWQPVEYVWGTGTCAADDQTLGDCGPLCEECVWSWPTSDPAQWDSKDADCRCKQPLDELPAPRPDGTDGGDPDSGPDADSDVDYEYGAKCQEGDGFCSPDCTACRWSWPAADPARCDSDHAACRCGPADSSEWTFIRDCEGKCAAGCTSCRWAWPTADDEACGSPQGACTCADDADDDHVYP